MRVFQIYYGLLDNYLQVLDNYRNGVDLMKIDHLRATEIKCNSLDNAKRIANKIAREHEEIESRFAYESPRWSDVYDILYHDKIGYNKGVTRIFNRDVHNTGKVAYITVSWFLNPQEQEQERKK